MKTRLGVALVLGTLAFPILAGAEDCESSEFLRLASIRTGASIESLMAFETAIGDTAGMRPCDAIAAVEQAAYALRTDPNVEKNYNSMGIRTREANGKLRDPVLILIDLSHYLVAHGGNSP